MHSHWRLWLTAVNITVHIGMFTKLGILACAAINGCSGRHMPQNKKTFDLRKIVKKFSMNLKKTRWKFERAVEIIKKEN